MPSLKKNLDRSIELIKTKYKYIYREICRLKTMLLPYKTHSDSIEIQQGWAKKWLSMNDQEYSSKGWGYVDRYNPGLGDYAQVMNLLIKKCANKKTIDLGCLDGKWSEIIIQHAQFLTLIDLTEELLPILKNKFGNKFNFYKTKGNEL